MNSFARLARLSLAQKLQRIIGFGFASRQTKDCGQNQFVAWKQSLSPESCRVFLCHRAGFSLSELLIAGGIGIALLLVVLQIFGQGATWMGEGIRQGRIDRQAYAALDWLGEDLHFRDERYGVLVNYSLGETELVWVAREAQQNQLGERVILRYYTAVTNEDHESALDIFSTRKLYRQRIGLEQSAQLLEGESRLENVLAQLPSKDPLQDEYLADQIGKVKLRAWSQSELGELFLLSEAQDRWLEFEQFDLFELECWVLSVAECRKRSQDNLWQTALQEAEGQRFARKSRS